MAAGPSPRRRLSSRGDRPLDRLRSALLRSIPCAINSTGYVTSFSASHWPMESCAPRRRDTRRSPVKLSPIITRRKSERESCYVSWGKHDRGSYSSKQPRQQVGPDGMKQRFPGGVSSVELGLGGIRQRQQGDGRPRESETSRGKRKGHPLASHWRAKPSWLGVGGGTHKPDLNWQIMRSKRNRPATHLAVYGKAIRGRTVGA